MFASSAAETAGLDKSMPDLVALLVHLRVLAVGRLGVTAVVTIGAVVRIAGGGAILGDALCEPWALGAILRTRRVTRRSRLITDGRELRVTRRLAGHADSLTHLAVDRRLGAVLVTAVLVSGALPLLVGLALGFLFLLLCLPLLADFFELCR